VAMKKFMLSILVTLALCAATAVAQAGAQGTQRSSPTMGSPNSQQQPGMSQPGAQPDQTSPTAQTDQTTPNQKANETSGKTLKGCVESQGGQYMLETKKGSIPLTGQDVSAHVGHEVKVKGAWEKAGSAASTESNSGAMSGKSFNVASVDMVSENCKVKGKGSSSGMGTGSGTGTGTPNQPQ